MQLFKQKDFTVLLIFVVLIGGFAWYYFYKKNIKRLKAICISWANTDQDPVSRDKRISGINLMPDSEIKTLSKIVTEYFNTNTQLPVELQKFYDYAVNKYGIGG